MDVFTRRVAGIDRSAFDQIPVFARGIDGDMRVGLDLQLQCIAKPLEQRHLELPQKRSNVAYAILGQCLCSECGDGAIVGREQVFVRIFTQRELEQQFIHVKRREQRPARKLRKDAILLGGFQRLHFGFAEPRKGQRLERL